MPSPLTDTTPAALATETITTTTTTTTNSHDDSLRKPLLLSSDDETELNSDIPTETLTLEDEEESICQGDYVGWKAVTLSMISSFCVIVPTVLFPVSLFLPWANTVVRAYLHTGDLKLDKFFDYELVRI